MAKRMLRWSRCSRKSLRSDARMWRSFRVPRAGARLCGCARLKRQSIDAYPHTERKPRRRGWLALLWNEAPETTKERLDGLSFNRVSDALCVAPTFTCAE